MILDISFYGNKLGYTDNKEIFDNLTLEDLKDWDTIMYLNPKPTFFKMAERDYKFKNTDGSSAEICINALFGYMLRHLDSNINMFFCDAFLTIIKEGNTMKIIKSKKTLSTLSTLGNATLYSVGNQHWIAEKNSNHIIPKDKSVNIHEYYDVKNEGETIECKVSFFERGVGKTKACGSGAFCVGMHLLSLYENAKTIIIKTEDNDKYYVSDHIISVI